MGRYKGGEIGSGRSGSGGRASAVALFGHWRLQGLETQPLLTCSFLLTPTSPHSFHCSALLTPLRARSVLHLFPPQLFPLAVCAFHLLLCSCPDLTVRVGKEKESWQPRLPPATSAPCLLSSNSFSTGELWKGPDSPHTPHPSDSHV